MKKRTAMGKVCACAMASLCVAGMARAEDVTITIKNKAPHNGTFLTPVWVGIHDGTFDTYDLGSPASAALERLAEDGDTGPISTAFTNAGAGSTQATVIADMGIPPLAPRETATITFDLDGNDVQNGYLSFLSMVIPSNDAFVGNGDPTAIQIFDNLGNLLRSDRLVAGSMVLDAGTEVNDEVPANTAFFGQAAPDTGDPEGGVVHTHGGFLPPGSGGILDDPMFANADFTAPGYEVALIRVTPEPASAMLLGLAGAMTIARRRRANA